VSEVLWLPSGGVLPNWFGWWSWVAWAWDQGLQGLPGLVERLLGIDAELACLDREAVSGRRQALVALCRGCLGWCVQDEGAVSPAGGDDLVAFQLTEDPSDGGGGHAKVAGELADGWQAGALGKDAQTSGP
jgi:hypothetical protein